MKMNKKLSILKDLYTLYGKYAGSVNHACRETCSTCCTRNMTLTSLEAMYLIEQTDHDILSDIMFDLESDKGKPSYKPLLTLNQVAGRCLDGRDIPEEVNDPGWGVCSILKEDLCPVYAQRPFGCRCMMSTGSCDESGFADMDSFSVTVSHVFIQYIEHLDGTGVLGNFNTVMGLLSKRKEIALYRDQGVKGLKTPGLLPNQRMRLLLVPPEHQTKIRPLLNSIQQIFRKYEP